MGSSHRLRTIVCMTLRHVGLPSVKRGWMMSAKRTAGDKKITDRRRPIVLVVGPLFPQGGGVGMVDSTLLACGLDESFDMRHLNIERGQAGAGKEGQVALINLYYFAGQTLNLLRQLVFQRPAIVHQSVT